MAIRAICDCSPQNSVAFQSEIISTPVFSTTAKSAKNSHSVSSVVPNAFGESLPNFLTNLLLSTV